MTGYLRWKFRFEKLGEKGGWWTPLTPQSREGEDEDAEEKVVGEMAHSECGECKKMSPKIYQQGWMCLTETCPSYWRVALYSSFYI